MTGRKRESIKSAELKEKLRGLVKAIVEDDDYTTRHAEDAIATLSTLRDLKRASPSSFDDFSFPVPPEFRCPISTELMTDPVILATGQLDEGHRTCPQTQQVLSHTNLTPSYLVWDMIAQWCKEHAIEMPKPVQDINQVLLSPLSPNTAHVHPDLHEDLITTILNLSIHDDNKKVFGEDPTVIALLIDALKSGTIQTRSNAAAAIFTLSALDSNKHIIGKSGAIKHLLDLLEEGQPLAVKDAAIMFRRSSAGDPGGAADRVLNYSFKASNFVE
ncbi:U-box domain-containing protein [Arachis hypogaea]|nr:U-box domain-containing protein [Arachis hypogaea]